ncbi:MAG: TIM barrel protein [Methylovulum sp.]|nr:TIM barrel protein [Methylovulum sp.]
MLKFSANISLLFTEIELIDRFKAAKQAGFNGVEIQFPYVLDASVIKRELDGQQLKLVLFNVAADDLLQGGDGLACVPEKRGQFKQAVAQALDYAKLLKPDAVNVLPGRCFDNTQFPAYLAMFKENLLYAADAFAPLGIKTVFEAINTYDMPGFIIQNGRQMLDVLAELKHANLYMQYDIYHNVRMGEHVGQFIGQHADKIGHIQFADCPGRGQPGTGQIDFTQLFLGIRQSGYSGWLGAEYNPVGTTADSLGWLQVGG